MVNHCDGNPGNNILSNLEWCTSSENEYHKIHTLNKKPAVQNFKYVKHTDEVLRFNDKNIFGEKLQSLLKRFLSGERICGNQFPPEEIQSFYSTVSELRNRFGVPILSVRRKGLPSYKDYYIDLKDFHGIEIKTEKQKGGFKTYFISND